MQIKHKMLPQINASKVDFSNINWRPSTIYKVGHLVGRHNNLYVCDIEHTSGESFDETKFVSQSAGAGYHFNVQIILDVIAPHRLVISNDLSLGGPQPFILKKIDTSWKKALEGTDYNLSFNIPTTEMTVDILKNGDYRINY